MLQRSMLPNNVAASVSTIFYTVNCGFLITKFISCFFGIACMTSQRKYRHRLTHSFSHCLLYAENKNNLSSCDLRNCTWLENFHAQAKRFGKHNLLFISHIFSAVTINKCAHRSNWNYADKPHSHVLNYNAKCWRTATMTAEISN